MAIREWLARLGGTKASVVGLTAAEMPDKPLERDFDDATLLSTYRDDAWPYILANKIGEQASQAPLILGRPGTDDFEPVGERHPIQRLIDNPSPMMDGGEFVHTLLLYLELVGHAPIEVVPNKGKTAAELFLHNPGPWRIVPRKDGTIAGYIYQVDAGDVRWPVERMTYIRWPNPNNRWYGQGRLAAVRQEIMAEEYAAIRDKRFEKQYGVPPGILTSEMPIGETTAEELRKRWEKAVGGYTNAGRIAVLGSKTTYQPVALSSRDAEWLKQRQWRVEQLAAAFGVPMPLIRMEGATFSNAEQARAEFWEGTLQPRLNRIARMLTVRLLPLLTTEQGLEFRFDYAAIEALGENDLQAAQTAVQWANTGGAKVDEVRVRLGLPALGGPTGERLLIPASLALQSVEDIEAPPEPAPVPGEAPEEEPGEEQPPRRRSRKAAKPDRDVALGPIREQYGRDLRSYFAAQHGAVMGVIGKAAHEPERPGTKQQEPDLISIIIDLLKAKRFRDRLMRISEGPISQSITSGAIAAAAELAIETSFAIPASEAARQLVGGYLERLSVGIEQTTVDGVKAILEQALREEWDNATTRAAISDLFEGWADWRVDRIIRTETAAAYNIGSIGQYREAGIKLVRVVDGDGDEPCAAANGSLWTLEEAEGDPLAHPNCTRTWIPDTSGFLAATVAVETKADQRHGEIVGVLSALRDRPDPEPPVVNVTVEPAQVTIAEGAVVVHQAPVTVEPAQISAPVTLNLPSPVPVRKVVKRDKAGNVTEISEEPAVERGQ